tara:strand:- start:8415 stop:8570 length:156 start_codon:yes stop_codon:yes gene_type:complete
MSKKTVIIVIFVIGLLVVLWWLFKLALKLFVPLAIIFAGIYIWYKFFKEKT